MTNTKKTTIARWVMGVIFALLALGSGFHYSSLFFIGSAFLMFPFEFMNAFLEKHNIKTVVIIIFSVILLFIGIVTSPNSYSDSPSDNTNQGENGAGDEDSDKNPSADKDKENESNSKNDNDKNNTSKPNDKNNSSDKDTDSDGSDSKKPTPPVEEESTMVWVTEKGKKYHSNPNCSNMKSPIEMTIEEAESQNYTPCSKCH